jgi:hypothetical protein
VAPNVIQKYDIICEKSLVKGTNGNTQDLKTEIIFAIATREAKSIQARPVASHRSLYKKATSYE